MRLIAPFLALRCVALSIAGAALVAACSKNPETTPQATATAAASATNTPQPSGIDQALHDALPPATAEAVAAGAHTVNGPSAIAWRKLHDLAELDAAFADARATGKPVFMYWGAVWCPPCNQVKATIFNRPDFIDKSRGFVPVYLDGDLPGAQKLGERYKVNGYPTMVLFRPDGSELTRLPGEVDAQKYLQVLSLGLGAVRPMQEVLAQGRSAPQSLSSDDWRLLAFYSWDTADKALLGNTPLGRQLRQLAAACPPAQAETGTRLLLRALVAEADEAAPPATAGKGKPATAKAKPAPRDNADLERVMTVLADDALTRDNLDLVTNYAGLLTAHLTAPGTPQREQLASVWAAALDRLTADTRLSQGDRMIALASRIDIAKIDLPGGDTAGAKADAKADAKAGAKADAKADALSPVLLDHVRAEVARVDREVQTDIERQAVITHAAEALANAGLLDESDRLLQAELQRSHSPYYAMLDLADNAKQRGDAAKAIEWHQRAYDAAVGPATRVQWGVSYVNALVELAPQDADRIGAAATSVLGEIKGQPDAFYERNARYLNRMSGKLLAWNKSPKQAAVLTQLKSQRDALCTALPADDAQRATCAQLFAPPAHAKAPKATTA